MDYWKLRFNIKGKEKYDSLWNDIEFINYLINKITCRSIIYGKVDNLNFKNILTEIEKFCFGNIKTWTSSQLRIVSEEAKLVLGKLLDREVKFIEVRYLDEKLYLLNILNSVEKSDLINKKFEQYNIFRVLEKKEAGNTSEVYVSETFKDLVESHNLHGFEFEKL